MQNKGNEITNDAPISLKAGHPLAFNLKGIFCVLDSAIVIKHGYEDGRLSVKISNAHNFSLTQNFRVAPLPQVPIIITFEQGIVANGTSFDTIQFTDVELTSTVDMKCLFSFGNGYPAGLLRLLQGQHID
jgi:hypothetical protein